MSQPTRCAYIGAGEGALRSPFEPPACRVPFRASRESGAPSAPHSSQAVHRWLTAAQPVVRARVLPARSTPPGRRRRPQPACRRPTCCGRPWRGRGTWSAGGDRRRARAHPCRSPRIGNNLNQIARWANTHAETAMDAVEVIAHLVAIERAMRADGPHRRRRAAGCTLSSSPAAPARPAQGCPTICVGERDAAGRDARGRRGASRRPGTWWRPLPTRWSSSTSTARP